MHFRIEKSHALAIYCTKKERRDLAAMSPSTRAAADTLHSIFEPIIKSGLHWVNPDHIGAPMPAPILSDCPPINPDIGRYRYPPDANFWYYLPYAIRSPLDDLAIGGKTVMTYSRGGV